MAFSGIGRTLARQQQAQAQAQAEHDQRLAQQQEQQAAAPVSRSQAIYDRQKSYYQMYLDRAQKDPRRAAFHLAQAESVNPDTSQPLMQERTLASQEESADQYSAKVPDMINQEVGQVRSQLAGQLATGRRSLKAAENARGMLFSGRRVKGEGEMAAEAGGKLAEARGNTIKKVLGQEQDLHYKPIATRAGLSAGEAEQRGLLQGVNDRLKEQRSGYLQQGMGSIGQGIGLWAGGQKSTAEEPRRIGGPGAYPVKGS